MTGARELRHFWYRRMWIAFVVSSVIAGVFWLFGQWEIAATIVAVWVVTIVGNLILRAGL
jgi:hypothetical protein